MHQRSARLSVRQAFVARRTFVSDADSSGSAKDPVQAPSAEPGDDSEPSLWRVVALSGLALAVFAVVVGVATA